MADTRSGVVVPLFLSLTFLLVLIHPVVLAQSAWEEDGWLRTSYANERLENGDEFGCYGMPGLSWNHDAGAVAQSCRNYIEERINASQWGTSPISTYTPSSLTMVEHERVASQGFTVHGDDTDLSLSAWHNGTDEPVDVWDWYNLGRRGGSLEKGMASLEDLQHEISQGGLVNLYWIGRVNDATVRHDQEILDFLSEEPGLWLTTWGEAWSSWSAKRCYEFTHNLASTDNGSVLSFEALDTEQCRSATNNRAWNVPVTWVIELGNSTVDSVTSQGAELPSIEFEKNMQQGWWVNGDGALMLSVINGNQVAIELAEDDVEYDILGQTEFWNNHTAAVTIAGHETNDLFKWSKRFLDEEDIRFTWLVTPRVAEEGDAWIPYAIVGIGFSTIIAMLYLLKREGLGPIAPSPSVADAMSDEKRPQAVSSERSLDAKEDDDEE
ncbi:MAG: hypothetical protein ISP83_01135 [Candidatus Poseidonia sp.]|nr:hypothetical protein [Poseidonia sp.]MBL6748448.1 hypothetical protein [Poseidonia sp.]MBL6806426.1 hypothetical protein [Poseidonia sp.]MBL6886720.1 hypothetical protein [Poseidonia sp.]MBL6892362.1 hypothetical protein [Poseidonia sp.]